MASYQREMALARAKASDARAVRAIDREAVQHLAEREQWILNEQQKRDALRERYRTEYQGIVNQEYPLPAYGWRQHLTYTGGETIAEITTSKTTIVLTTTTTTLNTIFPKSTIYTGPVPR